MKKLLLVIPVLLIALLMVGLADTPNDPLGKVYVCKYVGTPGIDERLQTGQNPIVVSINAIPDYHGIGSWFADAQGRSYVLAEYPQDPEPSVADCPPPVGTSTPTATPTNYATPFPTPTSPVETMPWVVTSTPTRIPTYVTDTPTSIPTGTQATSTAGPTDTPTATPTPMSTETAIPTSTSTYIPTEVSTVVPTSIPIDTATPKPPSPAYAIDDAEYTRNDYLGTAIIDDVHFILYKGMADADGTLLLPSTTYGGAVYQDTIWVHRLWKTGWLHVDVGSTVTIDNQDYTVTKRIFLPYGVYPEGSGLKIATCYSDADGWAGVEVYTLTTK